MCCPNVGAKFRSRHLSQMMPSLGGIFPPLGQGDGCAQLDLMDLEEKNECTCCLLHGRGEISQNNLMLPLELLKSDGLHLNLLKKPKFLGIAITSSTSHFKAKLPTFQNSWHDQNGHVTETFIIFSRHPPDEGHVRMSTRPSKCGLTTNFMRISI